ncbi:MAG: hypothetical protein ABFD66_13210 [Smithella sp.]
MILRCLIFFAALLLLWILICAYLLIFKPTQRTAKFFLALFFVIAGSVILNMTSTMPPQELSQLEVFAGKLEEKSEKGISRYSHMVLKIDTAPETEFHYNLNYRPILDSLQVGQSITIWAGSAYYKPLSSDTPNRMIWQIMQGSTTILQFSNVLRVRERERTLGRYFGAGFLLVGIVILYSMRKKGRVHTYCPEIVNRGLQSIDSRKLRGQSGGEI